MITSTMARHVANTLNRDSVQQIIDHCEMSHKLNKITRHEAASFHMAAINLTEILKMQSIEEKVNVHC